MQPCGPDALPQILAQAAAYRRLEVEIGCGNGHFLAEYSCLAQDSYVLGVEIKNKRCLKAAAKLEKRGLTNAAVLRGRAEELLRALPRSGVDRFHIYFPDPWPKSKHRRRRFLRGENVDALAAALRPGGTIVFSTDFYDYFLQAKLLFIMHPALELSSDRPPEELFLSLYAQKFRDIGKSIHIVAARRRARSSGGRTP